MRSVVFAAIVIIGLLGAGLFTSAPELSAALGATPGEGSPPPAATAAAVAATPTPECSPMELALGETVFAEPEGYEDGIVTLWPGSGTAPAEEKLYLSVLTLPQHACITYRYRTGAVVLYVQQGAIEYTASATPAEPAPEVWTGDNDGVTTDTVEVMLDTEVTLHAGDWIIQDREVWYTFRNDGPDTAVVSIASYVVPPWDEDPCTGGCRKP